MDTEMDKIELKCPICGLIHKYNIKVDSSPTLYFGESILPSKSVQIFQRLFICPKFQEMFEATIKIEIEENGTTNNNQRRED